jgi:hypothetical protein
MRSPKKSGLDGRSSAHLIENRVELNSQLLPGAHRIAINRLPSPNQLIKHAVAHISKLITIVALRVL